MKILKFIVIIAIATLFFTGCVILENNKQTTNLKNQETNQKIKVFASVFHIYDFARNVGKDRLEIELLMKPGTELHSYAPAPDEIKKINNAELLIINGAKLERWIEKFQNAIENKNLKIIDSSKGIEKIKTEFGEEDPHTWVSLKNAKIHVENIKNALIEADPEGKEYYEKNAEEYIKRIEELDNKLENISKHCKNKEFIVKHPALGYLAKDYNFTQIFLTDVHDEGEVLAKDLANIIALAKEKNITSVFYTENEEKEQAELIAKEINGQAVYFNVLHNVNSLDENYLFSMQENIEKLSRALKCEE
jgi:zinc transport system substrate-binding protein